jgi:hypothetical protein
MENTGRLLREISWAKLLVVKKLFVNSIIRSSIAASKAFTIVLFSSLSLSLFKQTPTCTQYLNCKVYGFMENGSCQMDLFRIMDKHLKSLAPRHLDAKFISLNAEVSMHCFFCSYDSIENLLVIHQSLYDFDIGIWGSIYTQKLTI